MSAANLAGHLQRFFTGRLMGQLGASARTVASYRDTFRLLLKHTVATRRGRTARPHGSPDGLSYYLQNRQRRSSKPPAANP